MHKQGPGTWTDHAWFRANILSDRSTWNPRACVRRLTIAAENKLISAKHLSSALAEDAHKDETTRVHLILRSMLFALVLIPITLCFVRFEIKVVWGGKCSRDGCNYTDLGRDKALSGGLLISHINIIVCPMSTLINTCLETNLGGEEAPGGDKIAKHDKLPRSISNKTNQTRL